MNQSLGKRKSKKSDEDLINELYNSVYKLLEQIARQDETENGLKGEKKRDALANLGIIKKDMKVLKEYIDDRDLDRYDENIFTKLPNAIQTTETHVSPEI